MRRIIYISLAALVLMSFMTGCSAAQDKGQAAVDTKTTETNASAGMESTASKTDSVKYKDGVYDYETDRDIEGYYVKATVTVKDGKIAGTDWAIYDANRNDRVFDDKYEEVFEGFDEYKQQCRDNIKGMKDFVPDLLKYQDVNKVDCISGATWTYNKFQIAVKMALLEAKQ